MTKADLIDVVQQRTGFSRHAATEAVSAIVAVLTQALRDGGPVKIVAFGTFRVRQKRERVGRDPKTGEKIAITPRKVLTFRPSQLLRGVMNREDIIKPGLLN